MNCQKAQYLIQEYLENELDTAEKIELAQHLLECAECREEMSQMEQADAYFSRQPLLSPPESLREKIMAQLSLIQPEVEELGTVQHNPKKSVRRFWYILLSLGQICLAASMLVAIRPEWLLPTTWSRFLKYIGMVGWNQLLTLKTAGEHSLKLIYFDKLSSGSEIYNFLIQPSWIKLSLLSILLFLTFYLDRRLLSARRRSSGKV